MAQYIKRGKGWQARISWYDSFKKRHTKSKAGFSTKKEAQEWAVQNEYRVNQGIAVDKNISFYNYYVHYFNTYKKPKVAQSTANRYRIDFKVVKDYFGNTPIKKITRSKYQSFLNHYGTNHAPSSVRKLNTRLRSCVQSAILDDYLVKDFTMGVTVSGNNNRSVKVEYLNLQEIKRLIKLTCSALNPRYTSRYMILTAIYTGMRKEEIQALTWRDIDFQHQVISVNKAWRELPNDGETPQHFATHRFKKTKTSSSKRQIKVNRKLLDELMALKQNSSSNMVFMNCFNTIPTSNALNAKLRDLLAKLGLKRSNFHFHSLRHSHVALLLASGMDLYAISKRLGHSDISMTANTYAYLIDEYQARNDQKIVTILDAL